MKKGLCIAEVFIFLLIVAILSAVIVPNKQTLERTEEFKRNQYMIICLKNLKAKDCRDNWEEYKHLYLK